jgi:hypothetical protein
MPLSREDQIAILRHLQVELRRTDPELQALVAEHVEPSEDAGRALLQHVSVLMRVMSERSAGSHGHVLNLLNQSVRTPDGGPVREIRLELSPTERELLRREHLDLAALPDRTAIVQQLRALHDDILNDMENGEFLR